MHVISCFTKTRMFHVVAIQVQGSVHEFLNLVALRGYHGDQCFQSSGITGHPNVAFLIFAVHVVHGFGFVHHGLFHLLFVLFCCGRCGEGSHFFGCWLLVVVWCGVELSGCVAVVLPSVVVLKMSSFRFCQGCLGKTHLSDKCPLSFRLKPIQAAKTKKCSPQRMHSCWSWPCVLRCTNSTNTIPK